MATKKNDTAANTDTATAATDTAAADYDDTPVNELRSEAKERDLPAGGTRQELVARLEAADAEQQAVENAQSRSLLAEDRKVDRDGVYEYAANVRALADELETRLVEEVDQPLADAQVTVDDTNSGVLVAGAHRLRQQVETVRQALRGLNAAAAALGQDIVS